jgi:dTDP-glucose 4,6-dehydratase
MHPPHPAAPTTTRIQVTGGAGRQDSVEHAEDRTGHDRRYFADCTKIREELGYSPRRNFAEGLAETIRWYRDNRSWWEPLKAAADGAGAST